MKKYEAIIILNPNLSAKVDVFIKDFEKLLNSNSFNIVRYEDIGRRQLAYSINNHTKGHYLLFNIEGDPNKLIELENNIKYNESIIRYLFLAVKAHSGEDSQLLIDSKNKKTKDDENEIKTKKKESEINKSDYIAKENEIKSEEDIEDSENDLKEEPEDGSAEETNE